MAEKKRQKHDDELLRARMSEIGKKFIVLSGKGGVGKTTVAVNLAISMADMGLKTGLLDIDLHGPTATVLLGLQSGRLGAGPDGSILPIEYLRNLKFVSMGLLTRNKDDAVIWRGPMKYNVIRQFLEEVSWGRLDCLVIDSPPGTGDEPLSVAQMAGEARAIIVTTPQEAALADVRRSISFCNSLSLPVAGVIENMAGLICPHCNGYIEIFKKDGGCKMAEQLAIPVLGQIPMDPMIVTTGDEGEPIVKRMPESEIARQFRNITKTLTENGEDTPGISTTKKEKPMIKIAIPTAEGKLCEHFGHCSQFAIITVDEKENNITNTDYLSPPDHQPGVLPQWLHEQGVTMVIAGGMGGRAQSLFEKNGIKVITGAETGTPGSIVKSWLQGSLEMGNNVCDH